MIFTEVLDGVWDGKTPPLIKALRADQEIYKEAMEIFYETNAYELKESNGWSFQGMSGRVLETIESIYAHFIPEAMATLYVLSLLRTCTFTESL